MKVLVTVGTHPQPFDALLAAVARWAEASSHAFTVQCGPSTVAVPGARVEPAFPPDEFATLVASSDLVVAHLGCGIAREVQQAGVPALFCCRSAERGEHIDDHQLELLEALRGRPGLGFIEPDDDIEAAWRALEGARPEPPRELDVLIRNLKAWIGSAQD